ncbi:MAG: MmcB family DNA repair protein [Rhodospirillales bacterium]|nr:MmcB family DNA repair protein [Rhodospirillales bacterium]MDP7099733.1 MmcB family DNA repair protein [Rhodospirillales bacterium]MDP7425535.1 MmcB family DNA repair protein [Rhodospirillales bacterium]HJO86886.1 MmcB family DNA repair protein [Rhodospirillales bacterium]
MTRGICRYLRNLGYSPLTEYKLLTRRRVDVIGVNKASQFIIVEIKSSVADYY